MSTAMENFRYDVRKAPEELEREADTARDAVEETLSALEERLSPGQLVDRAIAVVKQHGGEFGENLLTQVRNNPVPTVVVGIGLAWLMAASKRPPPRADYGGYDASDARDYGAGAAERWSSFGSADEQSSSTAQTAIGTARDAMDTTSQAAKNAMGAAANAARSAADATGSAAKSVGDAAHRAAGGVRQAADKVTRASRSGLRGVQGIAASCTELSRNQPLVLGAIAVVAGAAIGALLPSTESENRWIGESSDEAKARLREEAASRTADLRDAAVSAVEDVQERVASAAEDPAAAASPESASDGDGSSA